MAQAFRSTRVATNEGLVPATLVVQHGSIVALRDWTGRFANDDLHDFGDLILLPGLVDSHVHINEAGRTH